MKEKAKTRDVKRYGWIPDYPDVRDARLSIVARKIETLPMVVDHRVKFAAVPVLNQANLGACTGFATIELHASAQINKDKILDILPSPLFVYYNERAMAGNIPWDSGAQIRDGIKSIAKFGVCSEANWPYVISRFRTKPSVIAYKEALRYQAIKYERLHNGNLAELLTCLADGFPFMFGFTVYSSFESSKVARTGIYQPNPLSESVMGGHAVCAWGYDRNDGTILVRNSWGRLWGVKGYFKMRFSDITNTNMCEDFWRLMRVE